MGMASSEVSEQKIGKVTGALSLLGRSCNDSTFKVLRELYADVIVGQEFWKRHTSVTSVMNGSEKPLTIGTPSPATSAQLSVAAPKLDLPQLFAFLLPECTPVTSKSSRYRRDDSEFIQSEVTSVSC